MADQDNEKPNSQNGQEGAEDINESIDDLDALLAGEDDDADVIKENNKKLFIRAKKAEGFRYDKDTDTWVKKDKPASEGEKKPKAEEQQNKPSADNSDPYEKDELRLIARGLSDEEIAQARIIAKGSDTSLLEAIKNPMFVKFQEDLKAEDKKEKAKLGASRGSGSHEEKPKFRSGLSRDEHKAAWDESMGKS